MTGANSSRIGRNVAADVAGAMAGHRRLLATVESIDDAAVARPSLLEGWTVGHVISHLARNADSHVRMLVAAESGQIADQYPGGAAGRAADIADGASRGAADLRDDLAASINRLETCWAATTELGWAGEGRTVAGLLPAAELGFRRWREVEVHHVDLGLAYGTRHWPDDYVRRELAVLGMLWSSRRPMGLTELPVMARRAPDHVRLAWLLGRTEIDGVDPARVLD